MKIGHPADKAAAALAQTAAGATADAAKVAPNAAAPAAANAAQVADASAKVELSSTAASLLSGGSSAEFDADKVARISEAIAGGTFKINADVIADKLIANAQELLTKVQR